MSALPESVAAAGIEALRTGWLTMGPRTQQLESALARRFRVEYAIATSSGTAALHLTLLAGGARFGRTVLAPDLAPLSCVGSIEATGAEAVRYPVDGFDPPEALAALPVADLPAALIARHHLGYPAELLALAASCGHAGVVLIEDARDALGGEATAPMAGVASVVSFSSRRVISCGEGGAVLTDDAAIADRVRSLRSHAMTSGTWDRHRGHAETYDVVDVGFNYRIDEVRAAMCEAALELLDGRVLARRGRAAEIAEAAESFGAVVPTVERLGRSAPAAVPMLAPTEGDRHALIVGLAERGIASAAPSGIAAPELGARLLVAELDGPECGRHSI